MSPPARLVGKSHAIPKEMIIIIGLTDKAEESIALSGDG